MLAGAAVPVGLEKAGDILGRRHSWALAETLQRGDDDVLFFSPASSTSKMVVMVMIIRRIKEKGKKKNRKKKSGPIKRKCNALARRGKKKKEKIDRDGMGRDAWRVVRFRHARRPGGGGLVCDTRLLCRRGILQEGAICAARLGGSASDFEAAMGAGGTTSRGHGERPHRSTAARSGRRAGGLREPAASKEYLYTFKRSAAPSDSSAWVQVQPARPR